jgi:sigma-B regulation protein RsbU (phosphoserine phosphatase)
MPVMRRYLRFLERRSKVVLAIAGVLVAAIIGWIDKITGMEVSVALLYLLPILLTAWFCGRWIGIAVSIQCAVEGFLAGGVGPASYSHGAIPYWNAGMMLGFYVAASLLLVALRQSLNHEAELARKIQRSLLPGILDLSPWTSIAAAWEPSAHVGGDYFDVFLLGDDRIGFCIADVSGHGIPAALLMSNVQSAVRLLATDGVPPAEICDRLNRQASTSFPESDFLTFLFGSLHIPTWRMVYCNAGHCSPIIIRDGGRVEPLRAGGIPLGTLPTWDYREESVLLHPGDKIFLYTDGVTEAMNRAGELFGEEQLKAVLWENRLHGPEQIKRSVLEAVGTHSQGNTEDDITMLCIAIKGGAELS